MRIIPLFSLLLSSVAYSGFYPYDCSTWEYVDVPIATRIPDHQIDSRFKQPQWRPADIKNGQCLHHQDSGLCNIEGAGNRPIFNSRGYTSSAWAQEFPSQSSPSSFQYCRNCKAENAGIPIQYRGSVESYHHIFDGIKYTSCYDKTGNLSDNNFDGCYNIKWEQQRVEIPKTCQKYVCEEHDEGYPGGWYDCPLKCPDFDNVAQWDYVNKVYTCKPSLPPPDPTEPTCENKNGVFNCFEEKVTSKISETDESKWYFLDDLFYSVTYFIDFLFESIGLKQQQEDSIETPDKPDSPSQNPDLSEFEIDIPMINSNFIADLSLFKTSTQCPASNVISVMGAEIGFNYSKLCNALNLLSNLVMLLAFWFAYSILRSS